MIFHRLEDGVDRLLAVVFALLIESVCLVDKEHSAHRFFNLLLSLDSGLPDISGNKARSVRLNQLPAIEYTDLLVELGEYARNGSLARARVTREHKVKRHRDRLHVLFLTHLSYFCKTDEFFHIVLDALESDQFLELFHAGLLRFFWLRLCIRLRSSSLL